MKRWLLLGFLAALSAGSAAASVTTYNWHQTSSTPTGLVIQGSYSLVDGSGPVDAHSSDASPNFGGLLDLNISAPNITPVTLADLVPTCSGCTGPVWDLHANGSDFTLFYQNAMHSEGYDATGYWIQAGSDQNDPCFSNICTSNGSWVAAVPSSVPAPASLPVFAAALVLFGFVRVRSNRIRS